MIQYYNRQNNRSNGRSFAPRNNRPIRFFNPSLLVKNSSTQVPTVKEVFNPIHTFSDFNTATQLQQNIVQKGYTAPTPIQDQIIPLMFAGRDVVGIANTGTGKTAAFLIPLINKTFLDRTQKVLIIAPTRELAVQIEQEFIQLARGMGLLSVLCIGGVNMGRQITGLFRGPSFVIGTPGRLKDLAQQHRLNLANFNNVVLDEVDRMLDMGFIRDVTLLLLGLAKVRQSAFFSATTSDGVQKIMQQFLNNAQIISVKSSDNKENVVQELVKMDGKSKIEVLHDLLVKPGFDKVLVFGRTKHGLERLARDLAQRGFRVEAIHGNKSQGQRQRSLDQFKNNRVRVLLATDVVSRGLDIDNVTHVINYDLPESYEDYIHRIGRTGRADKKGIALTIVE